MAPQPSTPPPKAATVLGAIGTFCWCVQIIPQIYKNWRRHSTEGVPGWMVFSWAVAMVPFGAYCTIQNLNTAIKVQPQLFCSLCLICWGQTLYYAKRYKPWQAALTILGTAASFASIQLILVFTLRIPYAKDISWPITTLGILGAILINLGLVAPYIDAYKRDWRIIGVSFRFLSIDFSGAVFSLLSLCFQDTLDKEAAGSYITVMVLETGICIIQCSWVVRKWGVLKEARREGKSFDEFVGGEDGDVEKGEVVAKRSGSSRDWTLAGFFKAVNRRHGEEDAEGEDNGKGGSARVDLERGFKHAISISASSSDETLVSHCPHSVHTFTHSREPEKNAEVEKSVSGEEDTRSDEDPKSEEHTKSEEYIKSEEEESTKSEGEIQQK